MSKEEKARNQSGISVVPLQRAGKQTVQRSVHKAAVSAARRMKVNLKINNPSPCLKGNALRASGEICLTECVTNQATKAAGECFLFIFFPLRNAAPLPFTPLLADWEQDHWKCDNAVMNGPSDDITNELQGSRKKKGGGLYEDSTANGST